MSNEKDLDQLRKDVQYLMDRTAIMDCIARHARGHDRHDVDLLTDAYHEDGIDEHGYAINPGPKYAEWANAVHAAGSSLHTHNITTHVCNIDGDVAHCESYVLVVLLNNRDREAPHDASPPTPPGIRITYHGGSNHSYSSCCQLWQPQVPKVPVW